MCGGKKKKEKKKKKKKVRNEENTLKQLLWRDPVHAIWVGSIDRAQLWKIWQLGGDLGVKPLDLEGLWFTLQCVWIPINAPVLLARVIGP